MVADGAGSALRAERGAEIAVHCTSAYIAAAIDDGRTDCGAILREAAASARNTIADEARTQGIDLREYASTLLAVIVSADGKGGALQLGDGLIAVSDDGIGWSWVFWPQRGEYANTTYFLTDANAMDQLVVEAFSKNVMHVSLLTDGLEALAINYATRSVFDPFFNGMIAPLVKLSGLGQIDTLSKSLRAFLASDRIRSRTDDDISLIIATRLQNN